MEEYKFIVSWCKICNQGWVQIVKDKQTNELFLCCSECESEWNSPNDVSKKELATQDKFGLITEPNIDEITQKGWAAFIIKD